MSDKAKAVAVAQDVIKHLNILKLKKGRYLDITYDDDLTPRLPKEGDLRQHVELVQQICHVCNLGACLLSKARLFDEVPMVAFHRIEDYVDEEDIRESLSDVFDAESLDMMEAAFEDKRFCWMTTPRFRIEDAIRFGLLQGSLENIVRATMENIISNDGVFNPPVWAEPKQPV